RGDTSAHDDQLTAMESRSNILVDPAPLLLMLSSVRQRSDVIQQDQVGTPTVDLRPETQGLHRSILVRDGALAGRRLIRTLDTDTVRVPGPVVRALEPARRGVRRVHRSIPLIRQEALDLVQEVLRQGLRVRDDD